MTRDEIVAAARECLGTRFRHQGRIAGRALDCAGVLVHVARRLNLEHADPAAYGRHPCDGQLEHILDAQPALEPIALAERLPGDVAIFRVSAAEPQHIGILTDLGVLHAHALVRKVCEHRLDDVWTQRLVRVYRFRGVTA
jgi:hypothetical protein